MLLFVVSIISFFLFVFKTLYWHELDMLYLLFDAFGGTNESFANFNTPIKLITEVYRMASYYFEIEGLLGKPILSKSSCGTIYKLILYFYISLYIVKVSELLPLINFSDYRSSKFLTSFLLVYCGRLFNFRLGRKKDKLKSPFIEIGLLATLFCFFYRS